MKKQLFRKKILFISAIIVALYLSLGDIKDYFRDTKITSNPVECKAKIICIEKDIEIVKKEGYGRSKVYDVVGQKVTYQFKVEEKVYIGSFNTKKNQGGIYKIEGIVGVTYCKDNPSINSMTFLVDKNKNITDIFCIFMYHFISCLFFIFISLLFFWTRSIGR